MSSDLVVRLELVVLRPHGIERRRVRHELRDRSVQVTESHGGAGDEPVTRTIEVGAWRAELAAACAVDVLPDGPAFPADGALLPWDLLVATDAAAQSSHPGVGAELLGRAEPFGDAYAALLRATRGRLRALGTARGRVGWVSWVLGSEGWRSLSPCHDAGPLGARAMVRLDRREPVDLAGDVATWVAGARA